MAPTMFSCFVPACEFVTAKEEPEIAIQLLAQHRQVHYPHQKLRSSAMAPTESHGSNCKWDNGIFTPSFKSGGEVASSPLNQGEEHCQAFSKEGGAGNQGGTDNLLSRGNVRQVHPAAK